MVQRDSISKHEGSLRGKSNFTIELIRIEGFEEQHWMMSFFERCRKGMINWGENDLWTNDGLPSYFHRKVVSLKTAKDNTIAYASEQEAWL